MSDASYIALGLLILVIVVFPMIVFPVLTLVDCFRRPDLSKRSKYIWGFLIVLTWLPAASLYSFVSSKRLFFRVTAVIALIMMGSYLYFRSRPTAVEQAVSESVVQR